MIQELSERQMDGIDNAEMFNSQVIKWLYVNLFIRREIAQIRRHLPQAAPSLLDVGCGTGWTTRIYADQGFRVTGLEPSAHRARVARERYGLHIIDDYLENLSFEEPYDVVVLRHVIEHFADPALTVRQVRNLLTGNGVLLITVPNIACLGRLLFETHWSWSLPYHCNFFSPRSLRALLNKEGFKLLTLTQSPSPFYFPNSFVRKFPRPLFKKLVAGYRVPAMAVFSPLAVLGCLLGMGDNLNVVARLEH
jgi:2-polyprenyl-3-methyl-5-hydroxy-6-metoxy-1,4-benzoquinol methylase